MRRPLIAFVSLVLASSILGATVFREQVASAAAAVLQVRVVNTTAEAVPVTQQGTAQVNVTNASLGVTVGNLPAVQAVRDADRPTAQPFAGGSDNNAIGILDGSFNATATFTVPEGKRLVLEHVSSHISLPTGQFPQLVAVRTVADGETMRHTLTPTPLTTYSGDDIFSLSQPIVMYADPGSTVTFLVNRFPANDFIGGFTWAVTGHLVDVP